MPTASNKPSIAPVSAGVQHAVCYQVIDIGTQPSFGNFPPRRKVMIVWELPSERITVQKDGKSVDLPRVISKDYTLSTDKKANLRRDLEAWRGKPFTADEVQAFEVGKLIGANCQLNIVHKPSADGSKTYANVAGIMPLPKGAEKFGPENDTMVYDIPRDGPIDFPSSMPEWMVNKIKGSEEYQYSLNPHPKKGPSDDDMANLGPKDDKDDDEPF